MFAATTCGRFMRYVDKESHPDGCWLWTGAKRSGRAAERGEFQVYVDGVRKKKLPYRWYYEQIHGPIPDGLCCMHTCFNGHIGCINPAHIRVGTDAENANMADRTGENHHAARVPDSVVAESIARVRAGEPRAAVAKSPDGEGMEYGGHHRRRLGLRSQQGDGEGHPAGRLEQAGLAPAPTATLVLSHEGILVLRE